MKYNLHIKNLFFFAFLFFSLLSCKPHAEDTIIEKTENNTNDSTTISTELNSSQNQDSVQSLLIEDNKSELNQNLIDSTKKYVYLTFDDGPYKGSKHINQIIKDEKIKATVFIVGLNAYTKDLKKSIDEYQTNNLIEVANHTYTHANRNKFKTYYSTPQQVLEDVKKNDTFFNLKSKYVRLPGRNTWRVGDTKKNDYDTGSKNTSDVLAKNQYYILGWDYEWNKINKSHPLDNPEKIFNGIMYRFNNNLTVTKNHLVLLMHDDMFDKEADAEKLRALIKMLKNDPSIVFEIASNYPVKLK